MVAPNPQPVLLLKLVFVIVVVWEPVKELSSTGAKRGQQHPLLVVISLHCTVGRPAEKPGHNRFIPVSFLPMHCLLA
jgi:hypothetical protein